MSGNSESYHEPYEILSEGTKNMHRAIVSLMEELEAIDWYQQRAEACSDDELAEILLHNKREEMEHAMMTLEWIRRRDSTFAGMMDKYLGAEGKITEVEEAATGGGSDEPTGSDSLTPGSLGIGSLKPGRS